MISNCRLYFLFIMCVILISDQYAFHQSALMGSRCWKLKAVTPTASNLVFENDNSMISEWVMRGGNMVLIPADVKPKALIHFLGGAFVGSVPHIFYKPFLESLARQGYIIIATPFKLQMNYMAICDEVIKRFDCVASELAKEFGPLVVVGIGHSLGAVLQTLITSLFPETPRAINVLISFNGQSVIDSVPWFEEIVVPLSKQLQRYLNTTSTDLSTTTTTTTTTTTATTTTTTTNKFGKLIENPLDPFSSLFAVAYGLRDKLNAFVTSSAASTSSLSNKESLLSAYRDLSFFTDQVPSLFSQIATGQEEFVPSFAEIKEVCRRMYRARRTLVIQFKQDSIDRSDEIASTLREANTIMRMKRPMVEMNVQLRQLEGTHLTPLALRSQDLNLPPQLSSFLPREKVNTFTASLLDTRNNLKMPPQLDCQGRDFLSQVMQEPCNLDSLVQDISDYLNTNLS